MPTSRHPVSQKQLATNRANAAKSTGPRTPHGKVRSAQNARKHGFAASTFAVVRLEDLQEVDHLRADLLALYQPVNSQELFAIARLETGLFTTCLNEVLDSSGNPVFLMTKELAGDGDIEITRAQNRNYLLGEGFHRMVQQLVPRHPLSGPGGTPLPPRGRRVRKAQSPAARFTERTHFRHPTRTK
jgi:hypothetical protein